MDPEGNDTPYVSIEQMEGSKYQFPFPKFLDYTNRTNELTFKVPNKEDLFVSTYYFIIRVGEKNSPNVSYPYYCTVKIAGVGTTKY